MSSEVVRSRPTETVDGDCPECGGEAVRDGRETVCQDCGLVVDEDRIDHGPEWRDYNDDDGSRSRVGQPATKTLHDGGLATEIGRYRDGYGDRLDPKKAGRLNRQRRYHKQARFESKAERILMHGNSEICRMGSALGLSMDAREQACQLFKQVQAADLLKGHAIEAMAAAAIYAIERINGSQLILGDVVPVARVDRDRITSAYSVINADLGAPIPPPDPSQYIGRICDAADLPNCVRARAADIAASVGGDDRFVGGSPSGVAAACVYLAARRDGRVDAPSQEAIAETVDICDMTLRKRRNDIVEVLGDGE